MVYDFERLNKMSSKNIQEFLTTNNDLVTSAVQCIVRMDEKFKNFPHGNEISQQLLRSLESKYSSTIENIKTTSLELFNKKELSAKKPEVSQMINILDKLNNTDTKYPINNSLIEGLVKKLFSEQSLIYRTKNVYIQEQSGSGIRFAPIDYIKITDSMEYMLNLINNNSINYIIRVFMSHALFEIIHPFEDGNGRVGRILISFALKKFGKLDNMIYVSRYFEHNRTRYYDLLKNITDTNGDIESWNNWLLFCLEGILYTFKELEKKLEAIDDLFVETKNKIDKNSRYQNIDEMVKFMFANPMFTSSLMKQELSLSRTTTKDRLVRLKNELNILEKEGKNYLFSSLLQIL